MIEIFCALLLGIFIGVFTGLIPGIHVNTICAILLSLIATLTYLNIETSILIAFISSLAITHTFFDVLPGLFLGIPGDSTFALLPGHRLVKNGYGELAIRLSVIGSFLGLGIGLLFTGLLLAGNFAQPINENLPDYIFFILVIVSVILIISEENRLYSLFVFFVSGILGILVFNTPIVPPKEAAIGSIFPALTGLFGISGLIWSLYTLENDEYENIIKKQNISYSETPMPSIRGGIAGFIVGILPGLGGANAATLLLLIERWLGKQKDRDYEDRSYLISTSSLNTSEAIIAIVSLYLIYKSRSGASVAIAQILNYNMIFDDLKIIIISMIFAGMISTILLWKSGPIIASKIHKYNYPGLNWSLIIFLLTLVGLLLGIGGIAVILSAAIVGLMPFIFNVRKGQLMGFFLMPVIIYYSGSGRIIHDIINMKQRHSPTEMLNQYFILISLIISVIVGIFIYYYITKRNINIKQHHLYAEKAMYYIFFCGVISLIISLFI